MPKVKVPRKSISLDMTAMCDMAFLLLTFFILTARMKAPEPAKFDVPSSIDTSKVQDKDMLKISISNDGRIFFSLKDPKIRREVIRLTANEYYKLELTDSQLDELALIENFGLPISTIKSYLAVPDLERKAIPVPGIPCTKANNELYIWVDRTRFVNSDLSMGVKADKECPYKVIKEVFGTMQEAHENNLSLITTLEAAPE
jgi:biopolymer transport protein ExbD